MFGLFSDRASNEALVPQRSALQIIIAFVALVIPQLDRLPWFCIGFMFLIVLWRVVILVDRANFPKGFSKFVLVVILISVMFASFSFNFTVNSAVTFFIMVLSLKLLEIKKVGDIYPYVFLMIYLAATQFLFSQKAFAVLYQIILVGFLFYILLALNSPKSLKASKLFTSITKMLMLSVPFVVVVFLFFPRIAPLWSVPLESGSARTGISDSMTPGDIANLAQSDARAFRAEFAGQVPPKRDLYWKGLILDRFDGQEWRSSENSFSLPLGRVSERFFSENVSQRAYRITIEPTDKKWGFSLDAPIAASSNVYVNDDQLVRFKRALISTEIYQIDHVNDSEEGDANAQLTRIDRQKYLQLPISGNGVTKQWVNEQFSQTGDRYAVIERLLNKIRNDDYFYSLNPPIITDDFVDTFLFTTKIGFCAHYASVTTYIARLLGIPARVVVGYQGGEYVPSGGYILVHQYDAHAWVEVWREGEGWERIDPTAYVSPERIESGIREATREEGSFLSDNLLSPARYNDLNVVRWIRHQMDRANYNWQKYVVGYTGESQRNLLKNWFDNNSIQFMAILMISLSVGIFIILYAFNNLSLKQLFIRRSFYELFCQVFAKQGVERGASEGPIAFAERLKKKFPLLAKDIDNITQVFVRLTYQQQGGNSIPPALDKKMNRQVNMLKQAIKKLEDPK